MLFQNLYKDILVCQKLKTKQGNIVISNVYIYIWGLISLYFDNKVEACDMDLTRELKIKIKINKNKRGNYT